MNDADRSCDGGGHGGSDDTGGCKGNVCFGGASGGCSTSGGYCGETIVILFFIMVFVMVMV